MKDVVKVLGAVTQADRLWQTALKQLDDNQLEGGLHLTDVFILSYILY